MGRKLTHKEFITRMAVINPNILILGTYGGREVRVPVKCKIDGYSWNPKAHGLLNGYGCPECGKIVARETIKWKVTTEQFLAKLNMKIRKSIELLSEYISGHDRIKVRCKKCDYIWNSKPIYLQKGYGCVVCGHKSRTAKARKTHDKFVADVQDYNPDIKILTKYTTGNTKIKVQCKLCDRIWYARARNLTRNDLI